MSRFTTLALLAALITPQVQARDQVLEPMPPDGLPVACSNLELAPGTPAGALDGDDGYLTEALVRPEAAITWTVTPPVDDTLHAHHGGSPIPGVAVLCHPTVDDNPDADYTLPDGSVLPHMATGSPRFREGGPWPVIVLSHGLGGSPTGENYARALFGLARQGWAVAAIFHGDGRFVTGNAQTVTDPAFFLANLSRVVELQAVRPLAVTAVLDSLAARPEWADHLRLDRVAGVGASLGGETLLLAAGAELLVNLAGQTRPITFEPRLAAGVGVVPFTGLPLLEIFGSGQRGVRDINMPWLAISGSLDTIAPAASSRRAVEQLTGSRYQILVDGLAHTWAEAASDDLLTWTGTFLAAYLERDLDQRRALMNATSVAGGMDDSVVYAVDEPLLWGSVTASPDGTARLHWSAGAGSAELGEEASLWLAATVAGHWYLRGEDGWQAWTGGPLPRWQGWQAEYAGNWDLDLGLPCPALAGVRFLAGYGADEAHLLDGRHVTFLDDACPGLMAGAH